jgi:hypothetical protein
VTWQESFEIVFVVRWSNNFSCREHVSKAQSKRLQSNI